jgi:hypothetical protein
MLGLDGAQMASAWATRTGAGPSHMAGIALTVTLSDSANTKAKKLTYLAVIPVARLLLACMRYNEVEESGTDLRVGLLKREESYPGKERSLMSHRQNKGALSGIFGGLSGGVFFFGLAIAIVSGHFLPVFFAALALTSLVGSLASLNAQGIYGGFQGFVFLMGLAILAFTGWWWPGILILLGIASILGTLNIPGIAGFLGLGILSRNSQQPKEASQPANHRYEGGYQPQQPPVTYQEGASEYQYPSPSGEQPYEQPQTQYPQEMPPQ